MLSEGCASLCEAQPSRNIPTRGMVPTVGVPRCVRGDGMLVRPPPVPQPERVHSLNDDGDESNADFHKSIHPSRRPPSRPPEEQKYAKRDGKQPSGNFSDIHSPPVFPPSSNPKRYSTPGAAVGSGSRLRGISTTNLPACNSSSEELSGAAEFHTAPTSTLLVSCATLLGCRRCFST